MFELGHKMIRQYEERIAAGGATPEEYKTLIDDVMEAHQRDPDLVPKGDLVMLMTGPYVAGLDTVATTPAAAVSPVLKHPDVLARIHAEVDTLYAKGRSEEHKSDLLPLLRL